MPSIAARRELQHALAPDDASFHRQLSASGGRESVNCPATVPQLWRHEGSKLSRLHPSPPMQHIERGSVSRIWI